MVQVPSVQAPSYGADSLQTNQAFDASNANRRLAEAKILEVVMSNAESAQKVFGGATLGNILQAKGGVAAGNFNGDFTGMSDRLSTASRNADVVKTLAEASKAYPDGRVSIGDMRAPPSFGANIQGHVNSGDRAALAAAAKSVKPKDLGDVGLDTKWLLDTKTGQYKRVDGDAGLRAVNKDPSLELLEFAPQTGTEESPGKKVFVGSGSGTDFDVNTPSKDKQAEVVVPEVSGGQPTPQSTAPVQPEEIQMSTPKNPLVDQIKRQAGVSNATVQNDGSFFIEFDDGREPITLPAE